MKKIEAYIKPNMLYAVTVALHGLKGMPGMTIFEGKGFGKGPPQDLESPREFEPITKLEIICQDEIWKEIVGLIEKYAHTGLRGDGRIIVTTIEQDIRIVTWETK